MVACEWNGFYVSRIDADCEKKRQKKKGSKQETAFKFGKGHVQKTEVPNDLAEKDAAKKGMGTEERDLRSKAKKIRQRAKSARVPKNKNWYADEEDDRFFQQADPTMEIAWATAKAEAQAKREKREAELATAMAEKEQLELLQAEAQHAARAVAHKCWGEAAQEDDLAADASDEQGASDLDEWEIV
mmetsp:Transcript_111974/g.222564  ORF Transcript_111974/g.222564 Transcript_111974/m.222564 type:complete len:186 (-) Transcript_111974:436-993(-)|eukprot:CAMPEP_0172658626 /NCGR_PEP_ID=MMETSP1074-20121228/2892_1 /TAXON_ID=2916 /ORGANISM="Ceratium fusus, Strain PA161109" /LENGTH=185 /DNA_ID=CAMNT_0013473949 /DNA_START=34 /DNA_END=591 /DNA_ORIENTATION=-